MNNLQSNKQKTVMTTSKKSIKETPLKMKLSEHLTEAMTPSMKLNGLFNKYQMNRFWTSINYDLYDRICEIKMQEI